MDVDIDPTVFERKSKITKGDPYKCIANHAHVILQDGSTCGVNHTTTSEFGKTGTLAKYNTATPIEMRRKNGHLFV
jgi:hypothetical protein